MTTDSQTGQSSVLSWRKALLLIAIGAGSFQLAYGFPKLAFLIAVYVWSLFELNRLCTARQAFYFGVLEGFLCFAPKLGFMWEIFGPAAIPLWLILSFWIGLFILISRAVRLRFGMTTTAFLIPCLWTGLEYFRSELYYLRFSWMNEGYLFGTHLSFLPFRCFGMYGVGFFLFATISFTALLSKPFRILTRTFLFILFPFVSILPNKPASSEAGRDLQVVGIQMEFPSDAEVLLNLKKAVTTCPDAQLFVLSEYTFDGPVPDKVRDWCRKNQRYLIAGGKDYISDHQYYNTAFVIGTNGEVIFNQAKSVPIQFFKDGLPAPDQKLWDSPWGRIGICICYDLSYTRVTDQLARLRAQAIIVPTMDVAAWGESQHKLHGLVAPVRAAEYGIPIFRLASSGISQSVDQHGNVLASAPYPGDEAVISSPLHLGRPATLPLDRYFAPVCVLITAITILVLFFQTWKNRHAQSTIPATK